MPKTAYQLSATELNNLLAETKRCVLDNPKADGYAKAYARDLHNGEAFRTAQRMRLSAEDAVRSQLPYIMGNLRDRSPETKHIKALYKEIMSKLRD